MPKKGDRKGLYTRFVGKFLQGDDDECWEWQGARSGSGKRYGVLIDGTKNIYAHRLAYLFHYGEIGPNLCVRHKCDNPQCVNPHHLEVGTHKDNSDDKWRRGRGADQRGERNPGARLKAGDVRQIRTLYREGLAQQAIAGRFGVSREMVGRIVRGEAWRHIA